MWAKEQQPRWKWCVTYVDHNLDDALGQVYIAEVFSPELKLDTLDLVRRIGTAIRERIGSFAESAHSSHVWRKFFMTLYVFLPVKIQFIDLR
jgi:hypothetical protein